MRDYFDEQFPVTAYTNATNKNTMGLFYPRQ